MKKFEFKIIDYHKGDTKKTLTVSTIEQLRKFKNNNVYKQVWTDFDNMILWVTEYHKFAQR